MSYSDFKDTLNEGSTDIPGPRMLIKAADRYFRAEQELFQRSVSLTNQNVSQTASMLSSHIKNQGNFEYRGTFAREFIQTPTSSSKNPGTPVDTLLCVPVAKTQVKSVETPTDVPQFRLMGAEVSCRTASTNDPLQSANTKRMVIAIEKEAEKYDGYGTNSLLIDDIPAKEYAAIWKTLGKQSFVGRHGQPTRKAEAFDPLDRLYGDVMSHLSTKCSTQATPSGASLSGTAAPLDDSTSGRQKPFAVGPSEGGDLMTF
jgi:hypothetical protein